MFLYLFLVVCLAKVFQFCQYIWRINTPPPRVCVYIHNRAWHANPFFSVFPCNQDSGYTHMLGKFFKAVVSLVGSDSLCTGLNHCAPGSAPKTTFGSLIISMFYFNFIYFHSSLNYFLFLLALCLFARLVSVPQSVKLSLTELGALQACTCKPSEYCLHSTQCVRIFIHF